MNVFQFSNIKDIIKYFISQLPRNGRGEISRIAQHLGVSPTLVSHVLSGEKLFTPEQTQSLISYFGFIDIEADYFNFISQYERAGTIELKNYWKSKLSKLKEKSLKLSKRLHTDQKLTDEKRAIFYSSPIYMMIRLYTSVGDSGKSLSDISKRFDISLTKCSEIINFLVECGLCNELNGRYIMGPQKIHLEKNSPHLLRFQNDWRMRAINKGEELSDSELMFTAPISISKKDFEELREETILFIKKFLDKVHESPAEEIACLNLDFFWIKK